MPTTHADAPAHLEPARPAARRRPSAVLLFIALMAVVGAVAGLTAGGVAVYRQIRPDDTGGAVEGDDEPAVVPTAGQTVVTGDVTALHAEGAALERITMPTSIVTPERGLGSGATIENVVVDGETVAVLWDAGRPLELSGDGGALLLDPGVVVDASTSGVVVTLDGPVHGFAPGVYSVATPVAVGASGVAEPVDSATFEASDASTVSFTGHATSTLELQPMQLTGDGFLVLEGTFELTDTEGTREAVRIELRGGRWQLGLEPGGALFTVNAVLEGQAVVQ